jgi:hypothetical protein
VLKELGWRAVCKLLVMVKCCLRIVWALPLGGVARQVHQCVLVAVLCCI